ncbi:hypothetical protein ACFU5O_32335 [Streptomyces sp. NPDC057445]|uniref:hypothetical protein n=1 Tax=Streptomyces sp. NPDC057445 TaxID=3346136 RepID=UPI0036A9EF33
MPAPAHSTVTAPAAPAYSTVTAPAASVHPAPDHRRRAVAAVDFFTRARAGHAATTPPPFRDGDDVSCPKGTEWIRREGRWTIPGHPNTLDVTDEKVTGWWNQRHQPGSKFALVHRLTPDETHLINATRYTTLTYEYGQNPVTGEPTPYTHGQVTGQWLRTVATHVRLRVFLELPSGIVTLYSPIATGVVFLPA